MRMPVRLFLVLAVSMTSSVPVAVAKSSERVPHAFPKSVELLYAAPVNSGLIRFISPDNVVEEFFVDGDGVLTPAPPRNDAEFSAEQTRREFNRYDYVPRSPVPAHRGVRVGGLFCNGLLIEEAPGPSVKGCRSQRLMLGGASHHHRPLRSRRQALEHPAD